jgi:hypothetical protein
MSIFGRSQRRNKGMGSRTLLSLANAAGRSTCGARRPRDQTTLESVNVHASNLIQDALKHE